ncbi:hypothetical protein BIT28_06855 [Photobacterium proteolyticum]|uniref:Porin domain-containing protein n=1 Tax=Photobacterium proteolyticum TaxID=1903952 RepID=A0A1Q9GER4_9GAMM|nr:porin [Photobacterium proteolyticum]OLQ72897.1 hypothetical protein BIT28_06855 [Photobacterium proteolyticum]
MKKSILALMIATSASSASAVELFNDDTTTVALGGYVGVVAESTNSTTELNNSGSRVKMVFTHALDGGWDIGARTEWALDALANSSKDQIFTNRLGYITADNGNVGNFTLGKAWSVYYDVAGATDMFWIYGGNTSGTYDGLSGDGGVHGTGRADDVIQYRNNFNGLQVGLQYQFSDKPENSYQRDSGYQAMLGYDFDFGLGLSTAIAETKFDDREDAKVSIYGAKFEQDAFYAAVNYSIANNHQLRDDYFKDDGDVVVDVNGAIKDVKSIEVFASYTIMDQYQLLAGYNQLSDDNSSAELTNTTFGASYMTGPLTLSVEYVMDLSSKNGNGSDQKLDDVLGLQARYDF